MATIFDFAQVCVCVMLCLCAMQHGVNVSASLGVLIEMCNKNLSFCSAREIIIVVVSLYKDIKTIPFLWMTNFKMRH